MFFLRSFGGFAFLGSLAIVALVGAPSGTPAAFAAAVEAEPKTAERAEADHASSGHASDHEAPAILSWDPGSAIWNLIIFLIVFAILAKFVWPNVLHGLQAREDKIREDLESAERANTKAQTLLDEYQSKLDEARAEAQSLLVAARQDAEASAERILEEAKAEASNQRDRALADIDNAKKVAVSTIAKQTSDLAMSVARSVVGRELKAEDHAEMIRQSLDRLPSQN